MRAFPLAVVALAGLAACERAPEQAAERPVPVETAAPEGTIRGQLTYPSDYIPEDLQVCAREITSGEVFCNSRREGDKQYSLQVPVGVYEVWAQTRDWPSVRAFFSEFVRCGSSAECTDHAPIKVVVDPGEETIGVDPGDWYDIS